MACLLRARKDNVASLSASGFEAVRTNIRHDAAYVRDRALYNEQNLKLAIPWCLLRENIHTNRCALGATLRNAPAAPSVLVKSDENSVFPDGAVQCRRDCF